MSTESFTKEFILTGEQAEQLLNLHETVTYTIKSTKTNIPLADANNQPIEISEELKQGFEALYSSFESNPLDQIEFVEVER